MVLARGQRGHELGLVALLESRLVFFGRSVLAFLALECGRVVAHFAELGEKLRIAAANPRQVDELARHDAEGGKEQNHQDNDDDPAIYRNVTQRCGEQRLTAAAFLLSVASVYD